MYSNMALMRARWISLRGRQWRSALDRVARWWWADNIETRIARVVGRQRMKRMRAYTKDLPGFRLVDVFRASQGTSGRIIGFHD
jgi:hypothetical protein